MFLSTITFGDFSEKNAPSPKEWRINGDDYGNSYYVNDAIRQKIRLGSSINAELDPVSPSIETDASVYKGNEKTFVSNNYKNMHLVLMNYNTKNKKIMDNYRDDNLLYVIFNNYNYSIVDFSVELDNGVEVVQTFHKSKKITTKRGEEKKVNDYQGLAFRYKDLKDTDDELYLGYIITHPAFVKRGDEVNYEIHYLFARAEGAIIVNTKDLKTAEPVIFDMTKFSIKSRRFYTQYKENKLVTNTYIVSPDEEEYLRSILKGPNNEVIVATEKDILDDDPKFKAAIDDKRIRAITFVGIDIHAFPQGKFYHNHRILYAYMLEHMDDESSFWVSNIKSN